MAPVKLGARRPPEGVQLRGADTDFKSQVLQATDLVQLIGKTVALKRNGRRFLGLCPFHQEKTPSFNVDPARQFFHCFGCKVSGNSIDFVMRRDRLEFLDALKALGQEAGLEMPKFGVSREKAGEQQVLRAMHSDAAAFFENLLAQPQGKEARRYLAERGFDESSIKRFKIGFVPEAWDTVLKGPLGRKYTPQQLAAGGLVKPREQGNGFYDTFRNRIIFPIHDANGRVIAFGGRVMPGSSEGAKYLNSPETPLFSKSRCAFGLDLARQRIVETRTVIVVEGYTDVMMAHQFGVSNVVSVLGTALTAQHVSALRRFAERIVLLFDADAAGDTAADRAVGLLLTEQKLEIAIASMPQDVDPDEYLLQHGASGFEKLIADATDALSFKWKQLVRKFNESGTLSGRQQAVEQYLNTLAGARGSGPIDPLRWGAALAQVSRLTEMPMDDLNRRFKTRPAQRQARPAGAEAPPMPKPSGALEHAERQVLGILLLEPEKWHDVQHVLSPEAFVDLQNRRLAEIYWTHQRDEGLPVFNEFLGVLPDSDLTELAVQAVDEVESLPDAEATLRGALNYLVEETPRLSEKRKLVAELRRTSLEPLAEDHEVGLLRQLQEKARQPNLRRA